MPEGNIESKIHPSKDFSASYTQVRLRVRSLVGPMCGEIEQSADQIIAGTTNAAIQRAALRWKIEAVPAMRAALFQPDPFTALGDSWVFCFQMKDYFQLGPGKNSLGNASKIAIASCQRLEEEMHRVAGAMTISGDVSRPRAFAQKWAREHPIRYSLAERESTLSRALEKTWANSFGTGEIVAQMTTSMDDLNRRLDVYSNQLFQQGRWEAELLKSDFMSDLPMDEILSLAERAVRSAELASTNLSRLVPSIERTVNVAEDTPKIITVERQATLKAMHEELTRSIEFMREERVAALEQVTKERIAAMKDLHEMMVVERKSLVQDMTQTSFKVVDHAFWRATQLIAAILIIGVLVFAIFFRKRA